MLPPSEPQVSTSCVGARPELELLLVRVRGRCLPSTTPSQPRSKPTTSMPRCAATSVAARIAAFMPGASPPDVRMPIFMGPDGTASPVDRAELRPTWKTSRRPGVVAEVHLDAARAS
jgi:hypothetical protein